MTKKNAITRREALQKLMSISPLLMSPSVIPALLSCRKEDAAQMVGSAGMGLVGGQQKKFLFVFGAMGGASINDSFLAVRESECENKSTLNVYPDDKVVSINGTALRAVDMDFSDIGPLPFPVKSRQSNFLKKYYQDTMIATLEHSSVSHPVGQKRILTGFDAWNGRTLQEIVALHYGQDLPLPNVNMSSIGFAERGIDKDLPEWAFHEAIANPVFFPFGLHGYKGIDGLPSADLINMARQVRDQHIDQNSPLYRTFHSNPMLQRWLHLREKKQPELERLDLINRLNAFKDTKDLPFSDYGLNPHAQGEVIRDMFPDLGQDPLQTQAALAYLMVTQNISCAVTMGLNMDVAVNTADFDHPLLTNTPTAFDYSHNAHRATQALLWNKSLDILDRLITLLKKTEYRDGESYWDHSLIMIATEFGRDKIRPKDTEEFTSGHHGNNGIAMISPMVNGGKILGGVDPNTLLTYGFDPQTGEPQPGRRMGERDIFAGVLQAMGISTKEASLPDMRAMRRS
ncbi:MAG: hypothetical protein ACOH5I_08325 [Oligoflexus sp.]